MKKILSGKIIAAIAVGLAAIAITTVLLVKHFSGKKDSYRLIQIYELKGSTSIEREGIGVIEAVENLYLESGDRITVGKDSYVRLKLDDDKYVLVEPESVLTITAKGNSKKGQTYIEIEKGAVTNEIQNKLSDGSNYTVTTPNSVMAVRGTVFRVAVAYSENGEVYTKVSTYEGSVASSLVFPDGTKKEDILMVEGGKEVTVRMDTVISEYVIEPIDITYDDIDLEVLEFLKEIMEEGTELVNVSVEEINEYIDEKIIENETEPETETEPESGTEQETETESESESETEPETESETKKNIETEPETVPEITESTETFTSEETTVAIEIFTVTFMYENQIFGTQKVRFGERANKPKLSPAKDGEWDFDFSKEIKENTIVYWK